MKVIDTRATAPEEISRLLIKPFFDQMPLPAGARAKIKEVFGADLSAGEAVARIIAAVREEGDRAVAQFTAAIDGVHLTPATFRVTDREFTAAYRQISDAVLAAIRRAKDNITAFHREQKTASWLTYRPGGVVLGQNCRPLERVGMYVPGGTAAYPSSVLMNAIPAKVAGVNEIIMVVPPARDGSINAHVLVAAREAGVDAVYKMGGAQAIAALAFGTATVPRVDKIVGPGNVFVTLAKKQVYGYVDIDMLAGPSEIVILADGEANSRYIAADLLSQAEHDPLAAAVLITPSRELAEKVATEVERQLAALPRQEIAAAALAANGLILVVRDLAEGIAYVNRYAPEHLEVMVAEPLPILGEIRHAGAIFLGAYSPEPLGDYLAGPNHVLPTAGTARFYSVLNVDTFMKKTSIIAYTQQALAEVSDHLINLATVEGLDAHANAVRIRRENHGSGEN